MASFRDTGEQGRSTWPSNVIPAEAGIQTQLFVALSGAAAWNIPQAGVCIAIVIDDATVNLVAPWVSQVSLGLYPLAIARG